MRLTFLALIYVGGLAAMFVPHALVLTAAARAFKQLSTALNDPFSF